MSAHAPLIVHYSDWPGATGAVCLGVVDQADLLEGGDINVQMDGTGVSQIVVHRSAAFLSQVSMLSVLRVVTPFDGFIDLRLNGIKDGSGRGRPGVVLTLRSMLQDLAIDINSETATAATPRYMIGVSDELPVNVLTDHVIAGLLAVGIDYISVGTCEATKRVTLTAAVRSPLKWLRDLEKQTEHEAYLSALAGDAGFELNLVKRIEDGVVGPPLEVGVNLSALDRERGGSTLATVVKPLGITVTDDEEPSKMVRAIVRVESIASDDLDLVPPDGGGDFVLQDGQWVGNYLLANDGTLHEIVDTAAPKTFTVASGSGGSFAVDDDVEIRKNAAGDVLVEVTTNPAATLSPNGANRKVRTISSDEIRHERNYGPNPYGARGSHTTDAMTCLCNGGVVGSTSVPVKVLRPSTAGIISPDDVLYTGESAGKEVYVTVGGTPDGSGNLTVTVNTAVTIAADKLIIFYRNPASLPTGWNRPTTTAMVSRSMATSPNLAAKSNGAHAVGDHRLMLKNLTEDDRIDAGDTISKGTTGTYPGAWPVVSPTIADAGGLATVEIGTSGVTFPGLIDGDDVIILKPPVLPTTPDAGDFGILIPTSHAQTSPGTDDARCYAPAITIPFDANYPELWVSVGLTYLGTGTLGAGGLPDISVARLELFDDTPVELDNVDDLAPRTLDASGVTDITLRLQYTMAADERLQVRVRGPVYTSSIPQNFSPGGLPVVIVRWISMFLTTQNDCPVIDGSWATPLAQLALTTLDAYGPDSGQVVELAAHDHAQDAGVVPDDWKIILGADHPLYDGPLNINETVRVLGFHFSPTHPKRWSLIVDTKPRELSGTLGGA